MPISNIMPGTWTTLKLFAATATPPSTGKVDFDTVNAGINHVHRGADRIGDVCIARDYSAIWEAQEKVMGEVLKAADAEKVSLKVANL